MKKILLAIIAITAVIINGNAQNREAINSYVIENLKIRTSALKADSVVFKLEDGAALIANITFDRVGQVANVEIIKGVGKTFDESIIRSIYLMPKGVSEAPNKKEMIIGVVFKLIPIEDKEFVSDVERATKRYKHKKLDNNSEEFLLAFPVAQKYRSIPTKYSSLWFLRYRMYQLTAEMINYQK